MALPATPELQTGRLVLRPTTLADAPQIQKVFPQWEIVRHLNNSVPWPYPDDGAERHLRNTVLPAMEKREGWNWSIRRKEAPHILIGLIGLMLSGEDNRGFWLDPQWQGRGYMSEAAEEVTRFWFEDLGMEMMRIPKAVDNIASRRISEKQGMRVISTGEKDFVEGRVQVEVWELTAEEWRARNPA